MKGRGKGAGISGVAPAVLPPVIFSEREHAGGKTASATTNAAKRSQIVKERWSGPGRQGAESKNDETNPIGT